MEELASFGISGNGGQQTAPSSWIRWILKEPVLLRGGSKEN
jgi:hypothetical protein